MSRIYKGYKKYNRSYKKTRSRSSKFEENVVIGLIIIAISVFVVQKIRERFLSNKIIGIIILITIISTGIYIIRYVQLKKKQRLESYRTISNLRIMDPFKFENRTAYQLKKNGFTKVKTTPQRQDGGYDITAEKDGLLHIIQCKRYSENNKVPVQKIRELSGIAKNMSSSAVALLITTGKLTIPAYKEAKKFQVEVRDQDNLLQKLHSLPTKKHPTGAG